MAETEAAPAANVTKLPPAYKILPERFKEISFGHTTWSATLMEGMTLEHAVNPIFWSHVASQIKAGDIIQVRTYDHSLFAEFYVRAGAPEVLVHLMRAHKIGADVELPADFNIKWNVGARGYDVFRGKQLLKDGRNLPTKEQAVAWLDAHRKTMAA